MALIVLDASVVIAFLDAGDTLHTAAVAAVQDAAGDELVIGANVYAEILVGPLRARRSAATVDSFLADFAIRIEPVTADVAKRAATIRARHAAIRLPDALTLALADVRGARVVLTGDARWRGVSRRVRLVRAA